MRSVIPEYIIISKFYTLTYTPRHSWFYNAFYDLQIQVSILGKVINFDKGLFFPIACLENKYKVIFVISIFLN